jgi:hypothetical protein
MPNAGRRNFRSASVFAVSLALLILGTSDLDATGPAIQPEMTPERRAAIVDKIVEVLEEYYVFADVAAKMTEYITERLNAGAYGERREIEEFARQLTVDLRSVSGDRHLAVFPAGTRHGIREPMEVLRRENYGFRKVEILPGNIGYLRLDHFVETSEAAGTAVAALGYLANVEALIIDLGRNGGGDPSMIQLLCSYLFAERTHLNSFYTRRDDTTDQRWTQVTTEGPRLVDVPIWVLMSSRSFSAAEEFAYDLQSLGRGTVVGAKTGGGAHQAESLEFPDLSITIKVPYQRAINPVTGTNWEGTGVSPDIEVPYGDAFLVAGIEAAKALAETESDPTRKFRLEWVRREFETRLNPSELEAAAAGDYVGEYGTRRFLNRCGQLWFQGSSGRMIGLLPMGSDLFTFDVDGDVSRNRIQFERGDAGRVTGFHFLDDDGDVFPTMARTGE